jgi:hypothetical protein
MHFPFQSYSGVEMSYKRAENKGSLHFLDGKMK